MANDLLVFSILNLPHLLKEGILRSLGGNRFQFTREYTQDIKIHHPAKSYYPAYQLGDKWTAPEGAIIRILDMSSQYKTVPHLSYQSLAFQFEIPGQPSDYHSGAVKFHSELEGEPSPDYGNTAPIATSYSEAYFYTSGSIVYLRGHGYDIDNDRLTFQWEQVSGTSVYIHDADKPVAYFYAPYVVSNETLTFKLTVSDGQNSTEATIDINIQSQ